jgi:TonB family protein
MAPIPPFTPSSPESPGARVPVRNRTEASEETIRQSSASLIFVKLRKMIASGTQSTDNILGAIAVAAHSLTAATGAAVAMPRDGAVVCLGRSGESAPELGARLKVDSGISGECLRTGVIMRCDDASRDLHVDAEVCRLLGLQSIAVVPLRGQHGRVGVLEAFSTESYAFTEDKMEILGRLAGLAEAAWARGMVAESSPVEYQETIPAASTASSPLEVPVLEGPVLGTSVLEAPVEKPPVAVATVPLAEVRKILASAQESRFPGKLGYLIFGAVALLVMVLLSIYGWKAWYRSSVASTANTSRSAASSPASSTEHQNLAAGSSSQTGSPDERAVAAAKIPNGTVRQARRWARGSQGAKGGKPSSSISNSEEIPQPVASSADPAVLSQALATTPTLPQLGVPISQGITGGVLLHKVQPIYPAEARRMHVQGSVVIDAKITAKGQVEDLKLISGDPLLAAAAMDAVHRWRYTPYSLNGQPIAKETRITISFIAPQ